MGWPYVVIGFVFVIVVGGFLVLTGLEGRLLIHRGERNVERLTPRYRDRSVRPPHRDRT